MKDNEMRSWRAMLFAAAALASCGAASASSNRASLFLGVGGGGGGGRWSGGGATRAAFVALPSRPRSSGSPSRRDGAMRRRARMNGGWFDDRAMSSSNDGGRGRLRRRRSAGDDAVGRRRPASTTTAAAAAAARENNDVHRHLPANDDGDGGPPPPLSECDAVRILRASPGGGGECCRTALDVLRLLVRASSSSRHSRSSSTRPTFATASLLEGEDSLTSSSSSSSSSDDDDEWRLPSSIVVGGIVGGVSPNVAAAALRRLCSPPFLPSPSSPSSPSSSSSSGGGGRDRRRSDDDRCDAASAKEERDAYERLMRPLLAKIGAVVGGGRRRAAPPARHRRDDDGRGPTLLPFRDDGESPSSSSCGIVHENGASLNWYAMADLSFALSSLADVLGRSYIRNDDGRDILACHPLASVSPDEERGSIADAFGGVIRCVSRDDASASSFVRCLGPGRLVRDVLGPLAAMETARRRIPGWRDDDDDDVGRPSGRRGRDLLISIASSYLVLPHSLEKLTASELSVGLQSVAKIYNPLRSSDDVPPLAPTDPNNDERHPASLTPRSPQGALLRAFMKRLRKYSVRSPATGKDLARALWSASRLVVYFEGRDDASSRRPDRPPSFEELIPLPTRLPGEDESGPGEAVDVGGTKSMSRTPLDSTPRTRQMNEVGESDNSLDDALKIALRDEAVIMFHTLINEIVHPPVYSKGKAGGVVGEDNRNYGIEKTKLESLSLWQIAEILQAATTLRISHDDIVPAIVAILRHLTSNPSSWRNPIRRCRSCKDISRVLLSLQRLRVGTGIFDKTVGGGGDCGAVGINIDRGTADGSGGDKKSNSDVLDVGRLECRCVQLLGDKFMDLVVQHKEQSRWACDPRTLATILRSGVMMFQGPSIATTSMLDAATVLILEDTNKGEEDEGWDYHSFLSSCNEFEVSNCLFAFATAKRFDQGVFNSLADQMMEDDIISSCTPSSASRTMWSCSMLLSLDDAGSCENHYKLVDLFHQLSPVLLSSSLSSTDISSAMWAMAKSEYVIDRGIFDQLAESMASDEILKQSNTRLVSQALWSCGKMIEFEYQKSIAEIQVGSDEFDESDNIALRIPPYVESAHKYVQFLTENRDQISPKQISQSIWAMGRLRLSDRVLIDEMGEIASCMHASLNAREIANTVWGLSKVDYQESEVISKIVRRIMSPHISKECTAQEASMLLFALGKLQIREEEALVLFSSLSMILKRQLNDATSQSIFNALWAHEVVGIAPPPELLSTWAHDRLGMNVSMQLNKL